MSWETTTPSHCRIGDLIPGHLFMHDVAWPTPLPPVLRPERARYRPPRREVYLQPPVQPWSAAVAETVRAERQAVRSRLLLYVALLVCFWAAVLSVAGMGKAHAAAVVVARPVIVARPVVVPARPKPAPVVHVPAPVVVSPSLAKPAERCERDGLGQCVGGGK
jgi:hypothetical protein